MVIFRIYCRMLCAGSMNRYSPGEHSEIDFKNVRPRPRAWPRPKMLKIAFFQIQRTASYEVLERYGPGEHHEMILKKLSDPLKTVK